MKNLTGQFKISSGGFSGLILLLVFAIIFLIVPFIAEDSFLTQRDSEAVNTCVTRPITHNVYYIEEAAESMRSSDLVKIEGADYKTIQTVGPGFCKDKSNAYYFTKKIEGAQPSSFEMIQEYYYSKDEKSVFYEDKKINYADPVSFQPIGDDFSNYSKDNHAVYYREKILADSDPNTFEIINLSWGKDKNFVFYKDIKIPLLEPKNFNRCDILEYSAFATDGKSYIKLTNEVPQVISKDQWDSETKSYGIAIENCNNSLSPK